MAEIINGILIPFLGTALGAMCVFFLKGTLKENLKKAFNGFAAGVMVAASFFSLLLPSIEQSEDLGIFSFFPAVFGLCLGFGFLLLLDIVIPRITEGCKADKRPSMLFLAVTLHNIPEGMAVGVVLGRFVCGFLCPFGLIQDLLHKIKTPKLKKFFDTLKDFFD